MVVSMVQGECCSFNIFSIYVANREHSMAFEYLSSFSLSWYIRVFLAFNVAVNANEVFPLYFSWIKFKLPTLVDNSTSSSSWKLMPDRCYVKSSESEVSFATNPACLSVTITIIIWCKIFRYQHYVNINEV